MRSTRFVGGAEALAREPALVDVQAHVAAVDRRHAVLRVEHERRVDFASSGDSYGSKTSPVEGPCEEVVVDAEQHVSFGIPGGQQRSRDDLAGVSGLQDPQLQAALVLERLLHVGRDRERVVGDEDDVGRLLAALRRSRRHGERQETTASERTGPVPSAL